VEHPAQDTSNIVPIGTMAHTAGLVIITRSASSDLGKCEGLARAQPPGSLYDEPKQREVKVGGLIAVAVQARTTCRMRRPTGSQFVFRIAAPAMCCPIACRDAELAAEIRFPETFGSRI